MPTLGGEVPAPRLARARRGVLLLDRLGRRTARPDRFGTVFGHQACCGRIRRVAVDHVRRPRDQGLVPVPQGVNTAMLHGGDDPISGANVVKAAADVLEPEQVADDVVATIRDERFFVLPHPRSPGTCSSRRPTPTGGSPACASSNVVSLLATDQSRSVHRSPSTLARLGLRLGEPIGSRRNEKGSLDRRAGVGGCVRRQRHPPRPRWLRTVAARRASRDPPPGYAAASAGRS